MKESKVTEGQSAYVLGDVGSGRPPAAMCRKLGVSELRPLRSVDAGRLKGLATDLSLDKHVLNEAMRRMVCGPRRGGVCAVINP